MNELLTILGYPLIGIGLSCLYIIACVFLFKLCRVCFNDGDYAEACVFASFLMLLIGAVFGFLGSVI